MAEHLLKEYLIRSVADDYENFEFLRQQIIEWHLQQKKTFSPEALLAAIIESIDGGLMNAYKFNSTLRSFQQCEFQTSSPHDYWFLKKGALGYPHNL